MVGARFSRIDVVFDNYHELPINIGGRSKRSKGNDILLKLIFSLSEIKQWGMFSSSNEKKTCLSGFFCRVEKQNCRFTIGHKSIFVTDGENVFKFNKDIVIAIPELKSNHEDDVVTRMMLHVQHFSQHFQKTLMSSPDTECFHHLFIT